MANQTGVSLPGAGASRTDLSRVQKVQRQAKIQNAPGGQYGQRNDLQTLAQGGVMAQTASAMSAQPQVGTPTVPPVTVGQVNQNQNAPAPLQQSSIFDAPQESRPMTSGTDYLGGEGSNSLTTVPDIANAGEMLARAMYLKNPTPQLRLIVEAYNEARG